MERGTFGQLALGARFVFASEVDGVNGLRWQGAQGPGVKCSARKYHHETLPATVNRVGTVRVAVYLKRAS